MTIQAPVIPGSPPVPATKLEPDAIGVVPDTVIATAPAGTVAASLAAVSAYGGGLILILAAIPMLIIANAVAAADLDALITVLLLDRAWRAGHGQPGAPS